MVRCEGNPPVTNRFPSQIVKNVEKCPCYDAIMHHSDVELTKQTHTSPWWPGYGILLLVLWRKRLALYQLHYEKRPIGDLKTEPGQRHVCISITSGNSIDPLPILSGMQIWRFMITIWRSLFETNIPFGWHVLQRNDTVFAIFFRNHYQQPWWTGE